MDRLIKLIIKQISHIAAIVICIVGLTMVNTISNTVVTSTINNHAASATVMAGEAKTSVVITTTTVLGQFAGIFNIVFGVIIVVLILFFIRSVYKHIPDYKLAIQELSQKENNNEKQN